MTSAAQEKHDAYKSHQNSTVSDREIEARALLICANQLEGVRNAADNTIAYSEALRLNQKLWTMLQVALCDKENPLPIHLKNILLNLSCYVDKVTFQALNGFKPQHVQNLIDINRNIAKGLSAKAPSTPEALMLPPAALNQSVMTSA